MTGRDDIISLVRRYLLVSKQRRVKGGHTSFHPRSMSVLPTFRLVIPGASGLTVYRNERRAKLWGFSAKGGLQLWEPSCKQGVKVSVCGSRAVGYEGGKHTLCFERETAGTGNCHECK
jgi:Ni,Fe-hydrogenase I cytochrome b subunit